MDEKKVTSAPEQSGDRDQALFAWIRREKQRKKRRRIIVTVSIVVVLALAIFFGVRAAKKKVREAVGSMKAPTVSEATVTTGSISTTVSGSGMLADADTQLIGLLRVVADHQVEIGIKAGRAAAEGLRAVRVGKDVVAVAVTLDDRERRVQRHPVDEV